MCLGLQRDGATNYVVRVAHTAMRGTLDTQAGILAELGHGSPGDGRKPLL